MEKIGPRTVIMTEKMSDRAVLDTYKNEKDEFKNVLLKIHASFTKQGEPNRVVTSKDVSSALGVDRLEVSKIIKRYFRGNTLDDILNLIELPYKKAKPY
jgi:CRP-like cAMP-binding protein